MEWGAAMLDDQTLITGTNTGHRDPHRELWAAVLICGLNDAAGHCVALSGTNNGKDKSGKKLITHTARSWIGTRAFREVCDLAGVPHTAVQAAYERGAFPIKGGSAGRAGTAKGAAA